jgi:tetratricopeptide (TPR) repeat protein
MHLLSAGSLFAILSPLLAAQPFPRMWGPAAEASYRRGVAALEDGRLAHAEELLRTATRLAPADDAAWLQLGFTLARQARRDEAIGAFQQALAVNPESGEARRALALAHWLRGDPTRALQVAGSSCLATEAWQTVIVDPWGPEETRRQAEQQVAPCAWWTPGLALMRPAQRPAPRPAFRLVAP